MRTFFALFALLIAAPALSQTADRLPDVNVLYIERTPRYPGYRLDYSRPGWEGVPILVDNRTRKPLTPSEARAVKRQPAPGERVTFTAHVQNRGSAPAPAWEYAWYIDGREMGRGRIAEAQPVGKEVTVSFVWNWQPGRHTVQFVADPLFKNRDLALHNNAREDATDAWSLIWAVDRVTYESFNRSRNFLGTQSFEDWAQWHVDQMNRLFDISPSPVVRSDGWRPRIRCDRVEVVESTDTLWKSVLGEGMEPLDAGYDGGWAFGRREDCSAWAAGVDWGLIHEWGHQLGLTDEYALDRPGFQNLVTDDAGDPLLIGRISIMQGYMMHGHGPTTFSPAGMAALITQAGRRRGYYGDYYYCIPKVNLLRVLDSEGKPVEGAKVAFWQDRENEYGGAPVFAGNTDRHGAFMLPNRAAPSITTDQGYTQRDNPFGKINVVGPGNVFFVRIEGRGHTEYTWMEITEFNLAYWSGQKERAVYTRRTRIPPIGAPAAPAGLRADTSRDEARLIWEPVEGAKGYRVYRALSDQFVFEPVSGLLSETRFQDRLGHGMNRYAVMAVGADGRESGFSKTAGAMRLGLPWGIVVLPDGRRYLRDARYGQTILFKPDGSAVGLVGSVHYHFDGSYDIALDSKGRLLCAKMGDGYDPRPGFRILDRDLKMVVDYRKPEGDAPGQVSKPMGIAANTKDHIFVADTNNDRVQEFTPDGRFVRVIGAGEMRQPMKVAFDRQDRLYVADFGGNNVLVYEPQPDGSYRQTKKLTGVKEPVSLIVDERGRVFVSGTRMGGVYMFDEKGELAWKWQGLPDQPVHNPRGLAFDGRGNLLLVDESARRIWTVKLP